MRKVFGIILAALVAVSAGGSFASAAGYVNQADIDIITASDKAYTDFIKSTNDEKSVTNGMVLVRATAASSAFRNVANHNFSSKLGAEYSRKAAEVKKYAGETKVLLDKIAAALRGNDYTSANQYLNQIQNSAKKYYVTTDYHCIRAGSIHVY